MPPIAPHSLALVALQYELALLVGQDLRLKPMLRRFFPPALKLIGCKAAHLWLRNDQTRLFEHRYAYPMRDAASWQANVELANAVAVFGSSALEPTQGCTGESTQLQFMPLGRVGFCLLIREGTPLDASIVGALGPILDRLSTACQACLDHEETELLRTVAAENEMRLRTVVEAVDEVIFQTDQAGRLSFINSAWTRITGFSVNESLGSPLSDFFNVDDKSLVDAGLRSITAGKKDTERLDARLSARNGSHRWVSLQIASNRGNTGFTESSLTGTIIDSTEQRLMIDALVHARTRAEEANKAKSMFLANMSHEIRTPMNGVIGLTQLALEYRLDPEVRTHLDMILSSGMHLLTVINDILDYSKIEANRVSFSRESIPLRTLVDDTLAALRLSAEDKGLQLETHVAPAVPTHVEGDPARLRQVLLNLLGNAVKFTHQGKVCLRIELHDETDHGHTIGFSVIDTGIGIAPEQQQAVFQSFTQADGSISRVFGGTGLGLAICQRLVRMMGGELAVKSEVDRGSEFSFTAHFARTTTPEGVADSTPGTAAPETSTTSNPPAAGLEILVAEDNKVNRHLMSSLLQKLGHKVTLAHDGHAAAEASAGKTFDLVLMDMQMPVMDGLAATHAIRERESRTGQAPVPIFALTANAMPGDRERCLAAGMDGYLSKPLRRLELDKVLDGVKLHPQR